MDKTINQIKKELSEIATAHNQINSFFFGNFIDAISRDAVDYPLMVATLQPGTIGDEYIDVNVNLVFCDKTINEDYDSEAEVHSDMLQICGDVRTIFKQYRFSEFLSIEGTISTEPFINRGHDITAGWSMDMVFRVYDDENWCNIPMTGYNFGND